MAYLNYHGYKKRNLPGRVNRNLSNEVQYHVGLPVSKFGCAVRTGHAQMHMVASLRRSLFHSCCCRTETQLSSLLWAVWCLDVGTGVKVSKSCHAIRHNYTCIAVFIAYFLAVYTEKYARKTYRHIRTHSYSRSHTLHPNVFAIARAIFSALGDAHMQKH